MSEQERKPAVITKLVLATTNAGKVRDFSRLFEPSKVEVVAASDLGINLDVEETGTTFEENARIKALAYAAETDLPIVADDSGISVHALGGAPGVHSARYAGVEQDGAANNRKLLEVMTGVEDRRAAFVVALVLVLPGGELIEAQGRCEGTVAFEERGSNGFGYDTLFWRDDLGRTFGESTPDEKNARSHRAAAVMEMMGKLAVRGLLP
jgi:XTP/dITP diphosphohydrolase